MRKRKQTVLQRGQILRNNIKELYGNILTAAREMDITHAAIYGWLKKGYIPKITLDALAHRGVNIKALTKGLE